MLLSDTMHLIGYQIFDRKKIGEERKKEKRKSGGIVAQYSQSYKNEKRGKLNNDDISDFDAGQELSVSPKKRREMDSGMHQIEVSSPEKRRIKDKIAIPSFLDGFDYLTEDDLDLLATFEEEQCRRQQTRFERIFPTRESVERLGNCFEC